MNDGTRIDPATVAPASLVTFVPREQHRQPWTADDIDRLCALASVNTPLRVIARSLGRSQEAVSTKARKLDLMRGPTL